MRATAMTPAAVRIGAYEVRQGTRTGSWFVRGPAPNAYLRVFRQRDEAILWTRRLAALTDEVAPC